MATTAFAIEIAPVSSFSVAVSGKMASLKSRLTAGVRFSSTLHNASRLIRASDPKREGNTSTSSDDITSILEENWNYLWKLANGSVAGAAVIKYGSILFPGITRPDIVQALLMISVPVVVAILLLVKGSTDE
ncbi:hypothetical protein Nepgr_005463 [Nepenthes gracilis]|uniref:Uncharacterized protein n=1 Tax=Nepenthes gracilis TaxID=150966 RepID=A0AAD3S3P7_NEPGR|nr:hypothetical protein Nepgr_005463 [Nepenthes gracilis]